MKIVTMLIAETGREECVDVIVPAKDGCNIFIEADSLERAQALLPAGIEKAEEAMQAWTPETAPHVPRYEDQGEHHIVVPKSVVQMERERQDFAATPQGQRFLKSIANAKEFELKHNINSCLNVSKMLYLSNKHKGSLLNGLFDVFALAYRNGYRDGRKKTGGA